MKRNSTPLHDYGIRPVGDTEHRHIAWIWQAFEVPTSHYARMFDVTRNEISSFSSLMPVVLSPLFVLFTSPDQRPRCVPRTPPANCHRSVVPKPAI